MEKEQECCIEETYREYCAEIWLIIPSLFLFFKLFVNVHAVEDNFLTDVVFGIDKRWTFDLKVFQSIVIWMNPNGVRP